MDIKTQGICSKCKKKIEATLFSKEGNVWMRKTCPKDGVFECLYFKDATLFEDMMRVVGDYTWCRSLECVDGQACRRCLKKTYNIMLDLTRRCNLKCPVCCSDAGKDIGQEPTIKEIIDGLPKAGMQLLAPLRKPNICLFGGEPAMREDLPQIIKAIIEKGYVPRLGSNGLLLEDDNYLQELKDAGLQWIVLQFDGVDDEVYVKLRGIPFFDRKKDLIKKLSSFGFKLQLGSMIVDGVNLNRIGELINFWLQQKNIFWLSLYPHSFQNRSKLPLKDTHVADVIAAIEKATNYSIRRKDFIHSMRFLSFLFKIFRAPNLRQKLSVMPLVLIVENGKFYPLLKLFNPLFAIHHFKILIRLVWSLPKLLLYQTKFTPDFVRFLIIEKLHSQETIDLQEASNCHMSFMTEKGFIPFDIYTICCKS